MDLLARCLLFERRRLSFLLYVCLNTWPTTTPHQMVMAAELQVDGVVRGHHVYKSIWTPVLGEELSTEREDNNEHDNYAV